MRSRRLPSSTACCFSWTGAKIMPCVRAPNTYIYIYCVLCCFEFVWLAQCGSRRWVQPCRPDALLVNCPDAEVPACMHDDFRYMTALS